jgi:hypothetical protein
MTRGVTNNPPMCKRCGKKKAVRIYCKDCRPIMDREKNMRWIHTHRLGVLVIPGIRRPPQVKIIKDPDEYGYTVGAEFHGKQTIIDMLRTGGFSEGTIVEAWNGTRLKVVNHEFVIM